MQGHCCTCEYTCRGQCSDSVTWRTSLPSSIYMTAVVLHRWQKLQTKCEVNCRNNQTAQVFYTLSTFLPSFSVISLPSWKKTPKTCWYFNLTASFGSPRRNLIPRHCFSRYQVFVYLVWLIYSTHSCFVYSWGQVTDHWHAMSSPQAIKSLLLGLSYHGRAKKSHSVSCWIFCCKY